MKHEKHSSNANTVNIPTKHDNLTSSLCSIALQTQFASDFSILKIKNLISFYDANHGCPTPPFGVPELF